MNASQEWMVVIGNGKRMARSWRKQPVMGEMDIVDVNGRDISLYAPGFDEKGEIVDDDLMRTWLPNWTQTNSKYDVVYYHTFPPFIVEKTHDYDLALQPDVEAGCY